MPPSTSSPLRSEAPTPAGPRLDFTRALELFGDDGPDRLFELRRRAHALRVARHGHRASFVDNLQINPSNVCVRDCAFCGFAAKPGESHAYVQSEHEIFAAIDIHAPREVHIVGGLNHEWDYKRSLALVAALRERHPTLYIKAFTAVEMHWFARTSKQPLEAVLTALRAAGMNGMPGGGAELFSERIRQVHFRHKLSADEWLDVHERAHRLGIPSNATMLFGFGETLEERLHHLFRLRELQDRSGGFVSFIPLAMQYGQDSARAISPAENLKVIAMSRLVLDNIPHIKAYWPMTGLQTAAAGLAWGADDLDGTIGMEKVAHASGASTPKLVARAEMRRLIELAGFEPVERGGDYRPLVATSEVDA
ncbi:MAG TPA: CofH family radical SAM protein [Gammaproteobacteria bacterium]|nr:CofH family radical SAM protein [Gammaproteobacteria bacterium]